MDEKLLEIREYNGEGFRPLILFGSWRVAILNYLDELLPRNITRMERHMETDEVFILTRGRATLLLGGVDSHVDGVLSQPMEAGKLYNVKRYSWHSILMSRDASVLLVENVDTAEGNSEYFNLSKKCLDEILAVAGRDGFGLD